MRSISVLGSDKQIAKWIPLATQHKLIGSYAQTELGHGKAAGKTAFLYDTRLQPKFSWEFYSKLSILGWDGGGWVLIHGSHQKGKPQNPGKYSQPASRDPSLSPSLGYTRR